MGGRIKPLRHRFGSEIESHSQSPGERYTATVRLPRMCAPVMMKSLAIRATSPFCLRAIVLSVSRGRGRIKPDLRPILRATDGLYETLILAGRPFGDQADRHAQL